LGIVRLRSSRRLWRRPLSGSGSGDREILLKADAGTIASFLSQLIGKRCGVRLVWLLVLLATVCEFALGQVFLEAVVEPVNCASSDAAVCLESLFYLE
jgi:hypothetical protein